MSAARGAPIRVFVVDEVPLIADVLATVLRDEPDLEVVGCDHDGDGALARLAACDVVLLSATLPEGGALELTRRVASHADGPRVLVTGVADVEAQVLELIEAGAVGYVLRQDSVEELLATIRAAAAGEAHLPPELTLALMERVAEISRERHRLAPDEALLEELTPREREVLRHIGRGESNREIAEALVIELGTVKNHVHSILDKLNVHSRHDAAALQALLSEDGAGDSAPAAADARG